jgi:hypothetical protein
MVINGQERSLFSAAVNLDDQYAEEKAMLQKIYTSKSQFNLQKELH